MAPSEGVHRISPSPLEKVFPLNRIAIERGQQGVWGGIAHYGATRETAWQIQGILSP